MLIFLFYGVNLLNPNENPLLNPPVITVDRRDDVMLPIPCCINRPSQQERE